MQLGISGGVASKGLLGALEREGLGVGIKEKIVLGARGGGGGVDNLGLACGSEGKVIGVGRGRRKGRRGRVGGQRGRLVVVCWAGALAFDDRYGGVNKDSRTLERAQVGIARLGERFAEDDGVLCLPVDANRGCWRRHGSVVVGGGGGGGSGGEVEEAADAGS